MNRNLLLLFAALLIAASIAVLPGDITEAQDRSRQVAVPLASPTPTPSTGDIPPPPPPRLKEDDEIIKIDTELVNLNVRVVDRNNRPINTITQSEFKIYEDGVLQQIEFFSKSEVPTNYSMVIDNSNSLRSQIEKVIEASKILVVSNRPADETSIIRFVSSEKIEILQNFTDNKVELSETLDNLYTEGGQTAIYDAVYLAAQRVTEHEKTINPDDRTRKALVLISDGEDRDSFYNEKQVFDLLRESEVQIFVIGFVNELEKEGGFIKKSPQEKAKSFLQRLANDTGGRAYFPNDINELNGIAASIATELRTQYSIGYIPTNDRKDGTYRNIRVSVDDGPNKHKRIAITRAGRVAEKESKK